MRASSSTTSAYASVSAPAPPYSSGKGMPIMPSAPRRVDELVRERLRAVQLRGLRSDLALRELARGATDQLVLGGKVQLHGRHSHTRHLL